MLRADRRHGSRPWLNPDSNQTRRFSCTFLRPGDPVDRAALCGPTAAGRWSAAASLLGRRALGDRAGAVELHRHPAQRGAAGDTGLLAVGLCSLRRQPGDLRPTKTQGQRGRPSSPWSADRVATPPLPGWRSSTTWRPSRPKSTAVRHQSGRQAYDLWARPPGHVRGQPPNPHAGHPAETSYFVGDTAQGALARLRSTPDGILCARETIKDLLRGPAAHLLRLRLLDRQTAKFRLSISSAGISQEFLGAPKDSSWSRTCNY